MTINEEHTIQNILERTSCDCAIKRRHYEKLELSPVAVNAEQRILAGSNTNVLIAIDNVEVKEFENDTAFPSDGYDVSFN